MNYKPFIIFRKNYDITPLVLWNIAKGTLNLG